MTELAREMARRASFQKQMSRAVRNVVARIIVVVECPSMLLAASCGKILLRHGIEKINLARVHVS